MAPKNVILYGKVGSDFLQVAKRELERQNYQSKSVSITVPDKLGFSLKETVEKNHVDAVVSPGNSFGFLNGGFDKSIAEYYGEYMNNENTTPSVVEVSKRFQRELLKRVGGYNPPGSALIVDMHDVLELNSDIKLPKLIHVSTMAMPERISPEDPVIFNSLWNLITSVSSDEEISNCLLTGLGTGTGGVSHSSFVNQLIAVCRLNDLFKGYQKKGETVSWDEAGTIYQDIIKKSINDENRT